MFFRRLTWALLAILVLAVGGCSYFVDHSTLGGALSGDRLQRAQTSAHYRDGKFFNTVPQSPATFGLYWDYLVEQLSGDQIRVPPSAIPVIAMAPEAMAAPPAPGLRAVWLGHASVYVELDGFRLLVDPMFSDYASPIAGLGPKRFHPPPIALADLPKIDAVMISHDHYDHLDMATIQYLSARGTRFFVPLGVGAHLDEWGIPKSQITELDWWEFSEVDGLKIICTPSRHYSGRSLGDQKSKLWSSWAIVGPEHRVYYSGDTGFSDHFQTIGKRLGPFDLSIVKIGAYGPGANWFDIHMTPEDAIWAHQAVRARRMLPVHWATFNMAFHDWDEPIERAVKAASETNVDLVTPRVGEVVEIGAPFRSTRWWELVKPAASNSQP